jgi:hypothetical protein
MSNDHTTDERLVRIETKLDIVIARDNDKEERIRKLEQAMWKIYGGTIVASATVSVLVKMVWK